MMVIRVENYRKHDLAAFVCSGSGGTAKNAWRLSREGINVVCLPKTNDNDVSGIDVTFGFHNALNIASEAIDRLGCCATAARSGLRHGELATAK